MAELLSQAQIAEWLDLTPRQIHNLAEKGLPTRTVKGKRVYPWPAGLQWYIKYKVSTAAPGDQGDVGAEEARKRENAARALKMEADAALAGLTLQERRGQLVALDFMAQELGQVLGNLRSALLNFPGRWSPELVGCDTVLAARLKLDVATDELMAILVRASVDDADGAADGDAPAEGGDDGTAGG